MKKTLRKILPVLALVLVVAVASVGGTIAWLTAKTDTVTNTFTVGDINIDLYETKYPNGDTKKDGNGEETRLNVNEWSAKLIPGEEYHKNPVVSVADGSEDCYLFVKFKENNNPRGYLDYTSTLKGENGWNQLEGHPTVWYREVKMTDESREWHLLEGDKVTVKGALTKDGMPEADKTPVLQYTAAAIQTANMTNVSDAWSKLPSDFTTGA